MATAKQIAWRKKFAAMAKAGTLKKRTKKAPARKRNPVAKKAAKRVALLKPKPVRRRNPIGQKATIYGIRLADSSSAPQTYAGTLVQAKKDAQRLANKANRAYEVVPMEGTWAASRRK